MQFNSRYALPASLVLFFAALLACNKSSDSPSPTVPVLSVASVTKLEGTGGTTTFDFIFTLSEAPEQAASVKVTSLDGLAKAGEDYQAVSAQVVSFQPGEKTKTLSVTITGDEWKEVTEDFVLQIGTPVNCTVPNANVWGQIQNDDELIYFEDNGYSTPDNYPGYTLVWADEFNGSALNTADWNFETGDGCPNVCGWGNNELQWYTANENLYLQRGKLIIEARSESKGGKNYTSTRITTQNKRTFTYGRIDIRAKLPYGKGVWPALWMLGTNITTAGWPACGEMDIMELLGQEPNKVYATAHYATGSGPRNISQSLTAAESFQAAFHVFSLVWIQDKIQFLVDDKVISTVTKANIDPYDYPFNAPFFFIFNVAVGGNWPGNPDASTVFPQWMMVDYVRVFQ
jgi:beta-glucanase (GH16 family)